MVAISLGAVGAALLSQHRFDMQPCPWCVLQRLLFLLIAAAALAVAVVPALPVYGMVGALVLSIAGMAAATWQHFVAAASASCTQTLADRIMAITALDSLWPDVFAAYASCAEAKQNLLGVPYEFYSLLLFAVLGLLAGRALRRA